MTGRAAGTHRAQSSSWSSGRSLTRAAKTDVGVAGHSWTCPVPAGSALAHDLGRRLVVAEAEEARVAQAAGAGPLREADLGDELGLDPRHAALLDRGGVGEGRVVAVQGAQARPEVAQRRVVEAGADLARVAQAIPVV